MLVIPAIDLKDGQCVRLRKGLMEQSTVFSDDPAGMAKIWRDKGAQRLHLVDLNGAFEGAPVNDDAVVEILATTGDMPVQIGAVSVISGQSSVIWLWALSRSLLAPLPLKTLPWFGSRVESTPGESW